jgi:hypothetical protein
VHAHIRLNDYLFPFYDVSARLAQQSNVVRSGSAGGSSPRAFSRPSDNHPCGSPVGLLPSQGDSTHRKQLKARPENRPSATQERGANQRR